MSASSTVLDTDESCERKRRTEEEQPKGPGRMCSWPALRACPRAVLFPGLERETGAAPVRAAALVRAPTQRQNQALGRTATPP